MQHSHSHWFVHFL